jgi:hypothetical protein
MKKLNLVRIANGQLKAARREAALELEGLVKARRDGVDLSPTAIQEMGRLKKILARTPFRGLGPAL